MGGVILLGDSVFFGIGASQRAFGSGKLIKKALSCPVLIKSFNHYSTNDALENIEDYLLQYAEYKYYVINFGNNDCKLIGMNLALVEIAQYRENLQKLISKIQGHGKVPVLCNLQPISNEGFYRTYRDIAVYIQDPGIDPFLWQKRYSDACQELVLNSKIGFIDIRTPLEKSPMNIWWQDGMHPNDVGHGIISRAVSDVLKNMICL
ncbi:MAG: SGNH/GDSL hydrolase family protein [Candidatus Omnitrophica bacterium]|nr:SGNH/GDSL hydrolase family protein [Candidatus Omnitrophota bacterium]